MRERSKRSANPRHARYISGRRSRPSASLTACALAVSAASAGAGWRRREPRLFFRARAKEWSRVEIARRIRKLTEADTPFDRIAILLRDPERYQPFLEEALRRAGIPAYFTRGVVRPHPAGRAFLALLACAQDGCSASRFSEYLSLGQVPRSGCRAGGERANLPLDDELLSSFLGLPANGSERNAHRR